jgi:hypothetical protein
LRSSASAIFRSDIPVARSARIGDHGLLALDLDERDAVGA